HFLRAFSSNSVHQLLSRSRSPPAGAPSGFASLRGSARSPLRLRPGLFRPFPPGLVVTAVGRPGRVVTFTEPVEATRVVATTEAAVPTGSAEGFGSFFFGSSRRSANPHRLLAMK